MRRPVRDWPEPSASCGRLNLVRFYSDAYARYCWPVTSLADIQLALFHLLASEGQAYTDNDHLWHMEAARLHKADPALVPEDTVQGCTSGQRG